MVKVALNSHEIDMNGPSVRQMLLLREDHAKRQREDYSHVFRSKSRFDLVRLSCIVVAIELAYAAETAFVSPILLQIGVQHEHMTMVWGLSPLLGFFISPILGSISDRCRCRLGRRRPLIIALSIGILLGLVLIPYGKTLGTLLGDLNDKAPTDRGNTTFSFIGSSEAVSPNLSNHIIAFIFTIFGTILLDFNADTCQTPSRAYLLDVCVPGDHSRAMSTFSIMAGFGGTFGYAIGAIDWNATNIGYFFGGNYQTVFFIVFVVFFVCFILTVTSFREIPLDLIESDELLRPLTSAIVKKELRAKRNSLIYFIKEATAMELKLSAMTLSNGDKFHLITDNINNNIINKSLSNGTHKNISSSSTSNGTSVAIIGDDEEIEKITLRTYLKSIIFMPSSLRILSITNLFCHMAHLSYCLYFTDFVGETVFGGNPSAPPGSAQEMLYNEGVRFGCWGLCTYALSCSMYSMLVEKVLTFTSTKFVYVGGILIYAVGMLTLAIWPTKPGVIVFSVAAGVMYATLFTMPYILVAKYHSHDHFKTVPGESSPLKQPRGLGTDIAIISSMVFVGQLIVSLGMGSLVSLIGSTSAILYAASGSGILAAICAMNVLYVD